MAGSGSRHYVGTRSAYLHLQGSPTNYFRDRRINPSECGSAALPIAAHEDVVRCLAVHNHQLLSGSFDCTIRVWDVAGNCEHVLHCASAVASLALRELNDSCGGLLACGLMDGTAAIWDLGSVPSQLHSFQADPHCIDASGVQVVWCGDKVLCGLDTGVISVWGGGGGETDWELKYSLQSEHWIISMIVHEHQVFVGSHDHAISVWE